MRNGGQRIVTEAGGKVTCLGETYFGRFQPSYIVVSSSYDVNIDMISCIVRLD